MATDWEAYAKEIEDQIAQIKEDLEPMEIGQMTLSEREGNGPWRDVTAETIARYKGNIATFEVILRAIRNKQVP